MEPRLINILDVREINKWLVAREEPEFIAEDLPATGFIVDEVAAVFLYTTDSTIGWLEGLVTNKEKPVSVRKEGSHIVIKKAIDYADKKGMKKLLFLTDNRHVMQHGEDFGFEFKRTYYLYKKEI